MNSSYLVGNNSLSLVPPMFFPFCCSPHKPSREEYQQHKLNFLKTVRDSLETRLAAVNAAIETTERQVTQAASATNEQ